MSLKSRGTNGERELVHMFWGVGWACFRAAGSGSSRFPSPDLIAGNNLRKLAIEVKITTEDRKYFTSKEIDELKEFSLKFGSEPWVAVRFFRKPWIFLPVEDLVQSKGSFCVTENIAERRGLSFEELTKTPHNYF